MFGLMAGWWLACPNSHNISITWLLFLQLFAFFENSKLDTSRSNKNPSFFWLIIEYAAKKHVLHGFIELLQRCLDTVVLSTLCRHLLYSQCNEIIFDCGLCMSILYDCNKPILAKVLLWYAGTNIMWLIISLGHSRLRLTAAKLQF